MDGLGEVFQGLDLGVLNLELPDVSSLSLVGDAAGNFFIGAAAAGAIGMRVRQWSASLSPTSNASQATVKALPATLDHVGLQLHCMQRQAVRRIEVLLPVEAKRKEMAANKATLTTGDKLQLWRTICVYRFASLIVWPVFIQLASNTLCAEAALNLVYRARAQAESSKGGGLMGLMVSNLMASFGAGAGGEVQLEEACALLLQSLDALCSVAESAVDRELGPSFKCSDRLTAERTEKILRAGLSKVLDAVCRDAPNLVAGPAAPTSSTVDPSHGGEMADDLRAVAQSAAFRTLQRSLSSLMFDSAVVRQLSGRVEACKDFNKESKDAPAFQIALQLGPVLFALSDAQPQLHSAARGFAHKLLAANTPA